MIRQTLLNTFELVDEFFCSARVPGQETTNRLMVKADGSKAELRVPANDRLYMCFLEGGIFSDTTINKSNGLIHHGVAFWDTATDAWTHPGSGTGTYVNTLGSAGPEASIGPKFSFEVDTAPNPDEGVIQVQGSASAVLNDDYHQFARVRIYAATFDAANFPTSTLHL